MSVAGRAPLPPCSGRRQGSGFGGLDAPHRVVAAETDRQVDQLGCGGRRAAGARGVGGLIERSEDLLVAAGRGQCQMPGLELGLGLQRTQRAVHRAAGGRAGVGVDAAGQQWVGEPHPVSVERRRCPRIRPSRSAGPARAASMSLAPRQQLDGGIGDAGHAEQQCAGRPRRAGRSGVRTRSASVAGNGWSAPPGPSPIARASSSAKSGLPPEISAMRSTVGREKVRPRRSEITVCSCRMSSGRTDVRSSPSGRSSCNQRGRLALAGVASLGDQDAERTPEPTHRELDGGAAGAVQPLGVVDGDRSPESCSARACSTDDEPARPPRAGRSAGPSVPRAQQHPVQRQALQRGQRGEAVRFEIAKQVGQRGERHHRFRLAHARREHPESALARLLRASDSHSVVLPIPACPSMTSAVGVVRRGGQKSSNLRIVELMARQRWTRRSIIAAGKDRAHHFGALLPAGHADRYRITAASIDDTLPLAVRSSSDAIASAARSSGYDDRGSAPAPRRRPATAPARPTARCR